MRDPERTEMASTMLFSLAAEATAVAEDGPAGEGGGVPSGIGDVRRTEHTAAGPADVALEQALLVRTGASATPRAVSAPISEPDDSDIVVAHNRRKNSTASERKKNRVTGQKEKEKDGHRKKGHRKHSLASPADPGPMMPAALALTVAEPLADVDSVGGALDDVGGVPLQPPSSTFATVDSTASHPTATNNAAQERTTNADEEWGVDWDLGKPTTAGPDIVADVATGLDMDRAELVGEASGAVLEQEADGGQHRGHEEAKLATLSVPVQADPDAVLFTRLAQLVRGPNVTYIAVKRELIKDFGVAAFDRQKNVIRDRLRDGCTADSEVQTSSPQTDGAPGPETETEVGRVSVVPLTSSDLGPLQSEGAMADLPMNSDTISSRDGDGDEKSACAEDSRAELMSGVKATNVEIWENQRWTALVSFFIVTVPVQPTHLLPPSYLRVPYFLPFPTSTAVDREILLYSSCPF